MVVFSYVNFHKVWFSFVLVRILDNSCCHWECTDVLQCLSCKMHGKLCYHETDDITILVFSSV